MMEVVNLVTGLVFLIALSLVDFFTYNKEKGYIPSVFTTMFLIIAFLLGIDKSAGITMTFGILGFLIGILFTDLDLWSGIADMKTFVACAMLFSSMIGLLTFALVTTIVAVILKANVKWGFIKEMATSIPFIPVILIAYLIAGVLI